MNIYAVSWTQFGSFGLNAVVIAASEDEALDELRILNEDYNTEIRARLIGICTDGTAIPVVVCEEGL